MNLHSVIFNLYTNLITNLIFTSNQIVLDWVKQTLVWFLLFFLDNKYALTLCVDEKNLLCTKCVEIYCGFATSIIFLFNAQILCLSYINFVSILFVRIITTTITGCMKIVLDLVFNQRKTTLSHRNVSMSAQKLAHLTNF